MTSRQALDAPTAQRATSDEAVGNGADLNIVGTDPSSSDTVEIDVETAAPASLSEQKADTGEPAAAKPAARRLARKHLLMVLLAVVVVAGVSGGGYVLYGHRETTNTPRAAELPVSFVAYTDGALGYHLGYPSSWTRTHDASGGLLLQAGGQDAVNVREFTLQHDVDASNLSAMQAVTNAVLSTPSAHLNVLASQQVTVGGLRGMYYLYYFSAGGEQGVHGHYFLFDGRRMFTIVVQALPTPDFQRLAPTFDRVVQSFSLTSTTK